MCRIWSNVLPPRSLCGPARSDQRRATGDQTERANDKGSDAEALAGAVTRAGTARRFAAFGGHGGRDWRRRLAAGYVLKHPAGRGDVDLRRRFFGVRAADPAHDFAIVIELQDLESQHFAFLAGDLGRDREVEELAGRDQALLAVAGPDDLAHLFGDFAVVGLNWLGELAGQHL